MSAAQQFTIQQSEAGQTLAAILRTRLALSWSAARSLCERGKVFVHGEPFTDPSQRVTAGEEVAVRPAAPVPVPERLKQAAAAIVYEDSQLVVVDKPAGISSVPYERGETGTAMDLIRDAWRAQGRRATQTALHIVHRLDKESSGLLLFAKTKAAERALQLRWRRHDIERRYLCVAHGRVRPAEFRIESYLVEDRGDGLRGSWRGQRDAAAKKGKLAVTLLRVLEELPAATVCEVQLETGKTHQIRIHLAERGHPLVGERVYTRDYVRRGCVVIESPRLLLHARTLGFAHPVTGETVQLVREPPQEFLAQVERLRRG